MLMRMLVSGGIEPVADGRRAADEDNPLGYFELEAVKAMRRDSSWLAGAPGKAVKVIHALLRDLPPTYLYRIIFMHRDLDEVLASQRKMLDRSGRAGASIPPESLKRVFAAQLAGARQWAQDQPNCACLDIHYHEAVHDPAGTATKVAEFVGVPDRAGDMAAAVDASLYRNRGQNAPGAG
jgi:hypothetical protein